MPISFYAGNFILIFFSFWYIRRISRLRTYNFRFNYQPKSSRGDNSRSFTIPDVLHCTQRWTHADHRHLDVQGSHRRIRADLHETYSARCGNGSAEGSGFDASHPTSRTTSHRESRQAVGLNSIRSHHKDLEIVLKWDNVRIINYPTSPIARA